MASKIDILAALMVSQIEALTGITCRLGPTDATSHPFCQVFVERYGIDDAVTWFGIVHKGFRVSIWIEGSKADVSTTIQTLVTHWESGADYIALKAATDLVTINPLESDEAVTYDGEIGLGKQDFILVVRYP